MTDKELIDKLNRDKKLTLQEWSTLISTFTEKDREYAAQIARKISLAKNGNKIYLRGIIEFTNICHNDCLYCGIRCSNKNVSRYRLTDNEILECCEEGHNLGYRTFVLQGGEDSYYTDERLIGLIRSIKKLYPDTAITLSIGERSCASYEALHEAGADRYLLRHETADKTHYERLHPQRMSYDNRIKCLQELKRIGYQTGCGMMVGTPYQEPIHLAEDMVLIRNLEPAMVGIGPFIPHKDTPFSGATQGNSELTLFLLSLTRIMLPDVLLPATTALGTLSSDGRTAGILAGCNIVMPNLSPQNVRKKYLLYDNKAGTDLSPDNSLGELKRQIESIGYVCEFGRKDHIDYIKQGETK